MTTTVKTVKKHAKQIKIAYEHLAKASDRIIFLDAKYTNTDKISYNFEKFLQWIPAFRDTTASMFNSLNYAVKYKDADKLSDLTDVDCNVNVDLKTQFDEIQYHLNRAATIWKSLVRAFEKFDSNLQDFIESSWGRSGYIYAIGSDIKSAAHTFEQCYEYSDLIENRLTLRVTSDMISQKIDETLAEIDENLKELN